MVSGHSTQSDTSSTAVAIQKYLKDRLEVPVRYDLSGMTSNEEFYNYLGISAEDLANYSKLSSKELRDILFKVQPITETVLSAKKHIAKQSVIYQLISIQHQHDLLIEKNNQEQDNLNTRIYRQYRDVLSLVNNGMIRYRFRQEEINTQHVSKMTNIFEDLPENILLRPRDKEVLMGINYDRDTYDNYLKDEQQAEHGLIYRQLIAFAEQILLQTEKQCELLDNFIKSYCYRLAILFAHYDLNLDNTPDLYDLFMAEVVNFVLSHMENEANRKDINRLSRDAKEQLHVE